MVVAVASNMDRGEAGLEEEGIMCEERSVVRKISNGLMNWL